MLPPKNAGGRLDALISRRNPNVLTVAHRGVWTRAPENSLAAIEAAIALGVDIVEIDAQSTADDVLVVMHDDAIDRTTTGNGIVAKLPYAAIQNKALLTGAGGPDATPSNETIPLLAEALEAARGRITVNIDTKYGRDLVAVADLVVDLGMTEDVIMKTEVNPDEKYHLAERLELIGKVNHMPLMNARPGQFAEDLRRIEPLGASMVEVKFERLADLQTARAELERQDIRLWVNTLDVSYNVDFCDSRAAQSPDDVWGTLIDCGVGAIQTDLSAAFRRWLTERGAAAG
ncbi:glycerophosphodiester phosphodiesterase family protein [Jiella sp. MQZ9-1]|uniref:Glycerophosphodiester phosphodiesterase family protein n=1 Tax=Jiella flava TaxID=2816857 RepID=A0A939FZN2_9HYPH|nr:glycerophosphodiester phosphodiesterase family protein [Jiella flava]MBO0662462.1 glycerophosphodiester phosphodiesterase family protein [Jiella flava]MCD2471687.1 glycerophosphodiester phosphodiesterase family protein [Jiella flava]